MMMMMIFTMDAESCLCRPIACLILKKSYLTWYPHKADVPTQNNVVHTRMISRDCRNVRHELRDSLKTVVITSNQFAYEHIHMDWQPGNIDEMPLGLQRLFHLRMSYEFSWFENWHRLVHPAMSVNTILNKLMVTVQANVHHWTTRCVQFNCGKCNQIRKHLFLI